MLAMISSEDGQHLSAINTTGRTPVDEPHTLAISHVAIVYIIIGILAAVALTMGIAAYFMERKWWKSRKGFQSQQISLKKQMRPSNVKKAPTKHVKTGDTRNLVFTKTHVMINLNREHHDHNDSLDHHQHEQKRSKLNQIEEDTVI